MNTPITPSKVTVVTPPIMSEAQKPKNTFGKVSFYGRKVASTLWAGIKLPFRAVNATCKGVGGTLGAGCTALGWGIYKSIKVLKHEEAAPFMPTVKKGVEWGSFIGSGVPYALAFSAMFWMDVRSDIFPTFSTNMLTYLPLNDSPDQEEPKDKIEAETGGLSML